MTCKKTKKILTEAEQAKEDLAQLARTRASIDVSFQNGHPSKAAEQRWFRCTHNPECSMEACVPLGIVPGEEATCALTTGIDSLKNALQRRDFKCPDNRF